MDQTTDQTAAITTDQIAAITTDQVVALSTTDIASLSTNQVAALSTDQVAAFLTNQVAALSTQDVTSLATYQTAAIAEAPQTAEGEAAPADTPAPVINDLAEAPTAPYHLIDSEHTVINQIASKITGEIGVAIAEIEKIATDFSHAEVSSYKDKVLAWLKSL